MLHTKILYLYKLHQIAVCMQQSSGMQEAMRLYSSAIDKLEKVLALQPNNVAGLVTCGLALKDMALCMQPDDPDTIINLEVCILASARAATVCDLTIR